MKKLRQGQIFDYNPKQLNKKDFLSIYEAFTKCFKDVIVTIENYQLDNIDEIEKIPITKISEFKIESWSPHLVYFEGRSYFLRISLSDVDDPVQFGLKTKIENIISSKSEPSKKKTINILALLAGLIPPIVSAFIIQDLILRLIASVMGSIGLCILFLYPIELYWARNNTTQLILDEKHDDLSFWKKNKDAIIIGLLVTIIGGIVVIAVEKLVFR